MRIWFDLSNSPHINLFHPIIERLKRDNEIIITSRPHGNALELLDLYGYVYTNVPDYFGKNPLKKIISFFVRIGDLHKLLKNIKPDFAIAQSSFHLPLVAASLRIKSIYMNDNEHALGNIPSFLFATYIFLPEYFPSKIARMQGAIKSKINYYPGLKEGIYLWNRKDLQFNGKNKNTIFIRPEPYTAQYYHGKVNFFDDVLKQIDNKYEVVILPRDKLQEEHYQNLGLINTKIVRGKYKIEEIADKCALFIGAGGSMTREMAVLGFPTICIYQGELLGVDRYLISQGLMLHLKEIDIELIKSIMEGKIKINGDNNKILNKGEQAFNQIIKNISSCGAKVDSGSTVID